MPEPNCMKIIIPGGRGQIGQILTRDLLTSGHEVVVLSRRPGKLFQHQEYRSVNWDGELCHPSLTREFESADVVINLAGRSVNCRFDRANRKAILDSRVNSTKAVDEAIRNSGFSGVWLQSSTAPIYADRYDAGNNETDGIIGGQEPDLPETWKFSIDVARAWEQTAIEHCVDNVRLGLMRSAMIMSPGTNGVFEPA